MRSESSFPNHLLTLSTFFGVRSTSPFLKRAAFSNSVRSYNILSHEYGAVWLLDDGVPAREGASMQVRQVWTYARDARSVVNCV